MRRVVRSILPSIASLAVFSAAAPSAGQVSTARVVRAPGATTVVQGPSSTAVVRSPATTTVVRGPSSTAVVRAPATTTVVQGPSSTAVVRAPASTTVVQGPSSTAVVRAPASTTVVRSTTVSGPAYASGTTVVVNRSQPGWWNGQAGFVAYSGPRGGYAYAPGYGYYAVTYNPPGGVWVVGTPFPDSLRRYVVVTPATYGLPPAPAGYGWYYGGNNFVMVRHSTGVVTRTVAGGW